jgi:hypothetical protein
LTAKAKEGSVDITSAQRDYSEVIAAVAGMDGDFGLVCKFRGYHAYVESNINKEGRAKIDIYYGSMGPFGTGHNHAVAYRDDPLMFVADEIRS